MPDDRSAATLLREVGLMADGPALWGRPVRHARRGVFVVELNDAVATAPTDLAAIGKWLERVPELRLDGERPGSRDLQHRLGEFWLPSQPVLFIGSTAGSVAGRVAAITKTVPGDRRPASSGFWLHFLRSSAELRVWWASTDAPEEYEDALLDAFAGGVPPDDRAALRDPSVVMPWATLRAPSGARKSTGITDPLLPEVQGPRTTADHPDRRSPSGGGRRRPGRGSPGPAPRSRARASDGLPRPPAYAAQGSPRKAPEPIYLSPEGHARIEAELAGLIAERPGVIKRIATAREHGDLKENAEYHAAREEQGFLEGRIRAIEAKLKIAVIVAPTERGARVELGARIRVEVDGEEVRMQVVSSAEASSREGRISSASPVGAALMGRSVGDVVTIRTPGGEIRYTVLEIE